MINTEKFNKVVADAKEKAGNDKKWQNAIDRAAREILSGEMIVSLFADDTALITTAAGQYRVNGKCGCRAAQHGHTQCAHRAGKRLMATYEETAGVAVSTRETIIAEIKSTWPKTWPPLAVELLRRFRVNTLDYLAEDMLQGILAAIA